MAIYHFSLFFNKIIILRLVLCNSGDIVIFCCNSSTALSEFVRLQEYFYCLGESFHTCFLVHIRPYLTVDFCDASEASFIGHYCIYSGLKMRIQLGTHDPYFQLFLNAIMVMYNNVSKPRFHITLMIFIKVSKYICVMYHNKVPQFFNINEV